VSKQFAQNLCFIFILEKCPAFDAVSRLRAERFIVPGRRKRFFCSPKMPGHSLKALTLLSIFFFGVFGGKVAGE
jgi:hypothetical protein